MSDSGSKEDANNIKNLGTVQLTCGMRMQKYFYLFIFGLGSIALAVIIYFSFAELLYVTFYPVFYEWISVFIKTSTVHIVFTIFASLSDFGLFFYLFWFAFICIQKLLDVAISNAKTTIDEANTHFRRTTKFTEKFKEKFNLKNKNTQNAEENNKNEESADLEDIENIKDNQNDQLENQDEQNEDKEDVEKDKDEEKSEEMTLTTKINKDPKARLRANLLFAWKLIFNIAIVVLVIVGFIFWEVMFYTTLVYSLVIIFKISYYTVFGNEDEIKTIKKPIDQAIARMAVPAFFFDDDTPCFYIFFVVLYILMSQIYIICISFMDGISFSTIGQVGILLGFFARIIFILNSMNMNIFQAIFFPKFNWTKLDTTLGKAIYVIVTVVYFLAIIVLIVLVIISKYYDYPYIDLLHYEKPSNTLWEKDPNVINQNTPEGFCRVTSELTGELTTQDFAVLTTLPRLYGVNNEGKCYIKPKFRGVFNATMKYIF